MHSSVWKAVRRVSLWTLVVVTVVFSAMRMVALTADFPAGISASGDLYTDEGWYTNAATNLLVSGRWYTPGDFNPTVNLPLFQVVQAASFGVFGASLATARATIVLSFCVVLLLAYRLVARAWGVYAAALACALLASTMYLFAYSRFAIMELPMTALVLAAVVLLLEPPRTGRVAAASACLCCALLVKTTAVFILPAIAFLVWTGATARRERVTNAAIVLAGLAVVAAYHALAFFTFHEDYVAFTARNVAERIALDPLTLARNIKNGVLGGGRVGWLVFAPTVIVAPVVWFAFQRRSRAFTALLLWAGGSLALISASAYQPARYYVPFAVPLVLLCAASVAALVERVRRPSLAVALGAYCLVVILGNAVPIVRYISAPRYTWNAMAWDVRQRIARSDRRDALLMGNLANTITLTTRQPSINTLWGTRDIAWKLATYDPGFYIVLGDEPNVRAALEADRRLVLMQTYDVFDNYYNMERVALYALEPR